MAVAPNLGWLFLAFPVAETIMLGRWARPADAGGLPEGDAFLSERVRDLTYVQNEALSGFFRNISRGDVGSDGDAMLLGSGTSCPERPFKMFMPAHTATCTTLMVVRESFKNVGISCGGSVGQGHDHNDLAHAVIEREGWERFKSTVSFVMAKDPWSRVISAAAFLRKVGINESKTDDENIADFRRFVMQRTTPNDRGVFTYLHSITDYSHAVPPSKTQKQKVVTYVGRVATLGESTRHVLRLLGVPAEQCIDPNSNSITSHRITTVPGQRRPRTVDFYDDETRGRVAQLWEEDIKNFGFRFGEM